MCLGSVRGLHYNKVNVSPSAAPIKLFDAIVSVAETCVFLFVINISNHHLIVLANLRRHLQSSLLTPSNQDVPPEVFPLRDEGQGQQGLQIHALYQQPEVIGKDAELEESHG